MKINIKKEKFLSSLNIVTRALKKGNLYPILECVLIDTTKENKINLTCTDGKEITIRKDATGEIIEKGKAAIEGILLLDIIKNMPENSDIVLEVNDKKECIITCGENIKKVFLAKDETTFPEVMSISKENKVVLNEYKIKKIIEKTSFSYDKNQTTDNIVIKGIYLKIDGETFIAKSMNGFTLSIINENLNKNFGNLETIIPGQSLEELNKLIKGEVDKDVFIYFNEKNISFEFNNTLFSSIIIPNSYINTDKILNNEYSTKVIINRSDFIESLNRSTIFTNDAEKKPVVFDIKDEIINIDLSSILGESYEKINIKKTGKDLRIAFNPNSLINILNVIEDENVTLYFSGPKQPIIIKDKQENYIYLLTAVNI